MIATNFRESIEEFSTATLFWLSRLRPWKPRPFHISLSEKKAFQLPPIGGILRASGVEGR